MGTLVFCDIEGTLIEGSLAHGFVRAGRRMHLFSPGRMAAGQVYTLLSLVAPARYKAGLRWRALQQLMRGQRQAAVVAAGRAALPDLQAMLKPAVVARLAAHKREGDTVLLLSGSLQESADLVAAAVGADGAEGTRMELRAGSYTGRMVGRINQGGAKADRARRVAQTRGVPLADCVAYGDSGADIPLLSVVGHPVAVDPDPALRATAAARGWQVLASTGGASDGG